MRYKTALRKDLKPGQKFKWPDEGELLTAVSRMGSHEYYSINKNFRLLESVKAEDSVILCDDEGNPIREEFPIKAGELALFRDYPDSIWDVGRFSHTRKQRFPFVETNGIKWRYCAPFDEQYALRTDDIPGAFTEEDI